MSEGGIWTVRRILEWTSGFFKRKNVEPARLSAELILAHILGVARIKLYTDYERELSEKDLAACRELVKRAGEQEPIAYLTGKAPFFNLEFEVTRDVLIPRPDTETVVENVLQFVRHQGGFESPRVLDLCTGSGCIAAAIAYHLKTAVVTATDISEPAVAVARKNIERLGLSGRVLVEQGDLFEPLERMVDIQPFDLIVANPPYIPTAQLQTLDRSVKEYEPLGALDGGLDGLVIHRRILADAPARLVAGGRIYLEIAFDQGELAGQVMAEYPAFDEVRILKDYGGRDRVITARRK
ncbi:MAG TPA: peptide chain release factor N(5)-glutamine methyltransferase [Tepidisphaeraceae bacterium]|jgi:release factor glutamine methyltransferase